MSIGHDIKKLIGQALSSVHAGDEKLANNKQGGASVIRVQSDSFAPNGPMARKYSDEADSLSPSLRFSGIPSAAKEIVVICEDPDAPFPQPFIHWILTGLKADTIALPEGVPLGYKITAPVTATQLRNSNKKAGYSGPMPPIGHGMHHYHFQVFALDTTLNMPESAGRDDLLKAMAGHVLAQGEVVGTFERK